MSVGEDGEMSRTWFGSLVEMTVAGFAIADAFFLAPQAVSSEPGSDPAPQSSETFDQLGGDRTDVTTPLICGGVVANSLGWAVASFLRRAVTYTY